MIEGDRCRSDCDRPVTQRLVMRSQSGRAWTVGSCVDATHIAEKNALAAELGFTPERLCTGWNGAHDCRLEQDHLGDHVCGGCRDRWNRGPWDDDEPGEWEHERPALEERCTYTARSVSA